MTRSNLKASIPNHPPATPPCGLNPTATCRVKSETPHDVAAYLRLHPEVMAVAVALSSRPSQWLAECVSRSRRFETSRHPAAFARRLGSERPRFTPSQELGETVVELLAQSDVADIASWRRLSEIEAVSQSLAIARGTFHFDSEGSSVKFSKRIVHDDTLRRRVPRGRIPKWSAAELHACNTVATRRGPSRRVAHLGGGRGGQAQPVRDRVERRGS